MNIRETVYAQVRDIAEAQNRILAPLTDDMPLIDSGLDSLCIAILVAGLDDELRLDPFGLTDLAIPATLGDLIRIYEHAAANAEA
jgi:acyl carrier protein